MKRTPTLPARSMRRPRLERLAVLALATLLLCSCRGPQHSMFASPSPALPQEAYSGQPAAPCPAATDANMPLPYAPTGPWAPSGISLPWPKDEYLADGGDSGWSVAVAPDWQVQGLEPTDTVAHFDTLDGRTLVQPSNRVQIYAPRFGAVRQVVSLVQNEQQDRLGGLKLPVQAIRFDEVQTAQASTQRLQTQRAVTASPPVQFRSRQGDGAVSTNTKALGYQDAFLPFENLDAIRLGKLKQSEMATLGEGVAAAVTWSSVQAVQVILDRQTATAEVGHQQVETVFTVDQPPACPKLRVIKVASTQLANPGDMIDFTIRLDNVGNQVIGNVVILDNLTTRLEYVADSAECSLPASFSTQRNEAQSLTVRCELRDPLPASAGGIVRFRCRVR